MINLGFSRLVRYEYDGKVLFGDLQSHENGKHRVKKLEGNLDQGFQITSDEHIVEKVRVSSSSLSYIELTSMPVALPTTKHAYCYVCRAELPSARRRSKSEQRNQPQCGKVLDTL
jgi:hypothetical protein